MSEFYTMELALGPNAYPTLQVRVEAANNELLIKVREAIEVAFTEWNNDQ